MGILAHNMIVLIRPNIFLRINTVASLRGCKQYRNCYMPLFCRQYPTFSCNRLTRRNTKIIEAMLMLVQHFKGFLICISKQIVRSKVLHSFCWSMTSRSILGAVLTMWNLSVRSRSVWARHTLPRENELKFLTKTSHIICDPGASLPFNSAEIAQNSR